MGYECGFCISRDRDALLSPLIKTQLQVLLLHAIALMRATKVPQEIIDVEGCVPDPFVAYGAQLEGVRTLTFDYYDRLAWSICIQVADKVSSIELAVLAAYSEAFGDFWAKTDTECKAEFRGNFYAHEILVSELVQLLEEAALNRADDEENEPPGRD